jgi:hypothetical protein
MLDIAPSRDDLRAAWGVLAGSAIGTLMWAGALLWWLL